MKVHETRSHAHSTGDEEKMVTRKQKADATKSHEDEQSPKKAKSEDEANGGKSIGDVAMEFDKFCKATIEYLSIEQMREILEANNLDASGSDDAVVPRCQDILFYGPLDECPICGGTLEWTGTKYYCKGDYSEWSTCTFNTKDPPRKEEPIKIPESVHKSPVGNMIKNHRRTTKQRSKKDAGPTDKPFAGMVICLSGRLSRTHQYWKSKIERYGGKASNSVSGVTCLVTTPAERERGGSTKIADALERGIPIVSEDWLIDSIEKMEAQPLEDYDISRDLVVEAKAILGDKDDQAEVKVYGKRGVHKDTKLYERGRQIFEKDGILYNCAFSLCDLGRGVNDFCVMQLIMVPKAGLHLFSKKKRHVRKTQAEERLEEWENVDAAIKEFAKLFEELTGNEFEPWEREKFQKKRRKFYPIDMDDGVDVRHGGLGFRQKAAAVIHCKLNPIVANFMKILCSQEIYRYALTELALDTPDIPMAMLSEVHLKRCETVLLQFIAAVKTMKETRLKARAAWDDFSMKWFTLLHSTRPFFFHDYQDLADHAAAGFETIRDITVASHLIGDMSGPTIDDPLFDRYEKLGCSISPVEKKSDDYKMIVDYLEETYEPVKIGDISYGVSVENIVEVEPSACPSYDEIKKLPNKVLLWCGTRSSNVLRHLQKGFLPSISWLPLPGYMFGKAIICTDAAAEAARYGFTAADRPEGFLVLAIASLGDQITEYNRTPEAEEAKILEENKVAVKGLGRKKTDESEHFVWKDDIKVPRGRLVKTEHKDSPLEYNEYAVYDPKQVSMRFVVAVKYEERGVVHEEVETEET
ncbi:protein ADP-ribosyltransferase PARP3 isoform X2 [Actinidia eriantha]|uniref:protein ADP-ribosyltransferase PARP3 isoform X2 n=1 Tax=Actinidia eriantha TaxID=165200 RepID=UPI00258B4EFB|nr:protein ADP-ribosyltransferase PARP3 isoform X2 [Actinidia eriantha]